MWRSFFAGVFAYIPARILPKYFFDKETQFWQYEAMWFVIFLAMYTLAIYLMRRFAEPVDKKY